jgi:hypothetical protein
MSSPEARLRATSPAEPYMTDATPTPDLQAICDSCLQPIADGEGHVWVDQDAAHTAARSTLPLLTALKASKISSTATPCPGTPPTPPATTCPVGRQRAGDHLEHRLERGRTKPAAQLTQCFFRHHGHDMPGAGQTRAQLGPDPGIANPREQPECEHEVHPGPRRQCAQPLLERAGLRQHVVN